MVVAADGEAVICQMAGKVVVPLGIFADAVDQLHHGFRLAVVGQPQAGVALVDAVAGGEGKLAELCH